MTNYEKYKDEIQDAISHVTLGMFISDKLKNKNYYKSDGLGVYDVVKLFIWLNEEYKEPEVDWSKVEVDTPILVKSCEGDQTNRKRYFAKYENGLVYAWADGRNSWSSINDDDVISWEYAKLAEDVTDD